MAGLSSEKILLKCIFFAFNLIFWVLGLVVFIVGIWSRIKSKDFENLVGEAASVTTAPTILICAGIFVTIISFVGCYGAWRESKVLLVIYAVLLIVIFLLEIIAGSIAYKNKGDVAAGLKKHLRQILDHDYARPNPTKDQMRLTKALDWFQENVKCCGTDGPDDWVVSDWYNRTIKAYEIAVLVPNSCCINRNQVNCNIGAPGDRPMVALKDRIYLTGCVDKGNEFIKDHLRQVGAIAVGVAFIQYAVLLIMIFLLEIIGGSIAYQNKGKVLAFLKKHLRKIADHDDVRPNPTKDQMDLTKALDLFQENITCCSADGPDVWVGTDWYNRTIKPNEVAVVVVPISCCMDINQAGCNIGAPGDRPMVVLKDSIYITGCVDKGNEFIKDHLRQVGAIAVGVAFIQLLGLAFAFLLCRAIVYDHI